MTEQWSVISEVISERRTVKPKDFTGEKVDDELIHKLLEQANWAPTHAYTEPWRFTVFANEGLKKLGDFYADLDQPDTGIHNFNKARYTKFKERPIMCSHVIGVGMMPGQNPKIPEIEEVCAVAMAVQNIWLGLKSLGLAGYWSTGKLSYSDEMRAFFGLPEGAKALGLFYIGVPAKDHHNGKRNSSIENKVNWIKG